MSDNVVQSLQKIHIGLEDFKHQQNARLDSFEQRLNSFQDRIEGNEAELDRPPGIRGKAGQYTAEDNEHKSVFFEWIRNPLDIRRKARLSEAQHQLQRKDVTIGSNIGGGYGVPKEISDQIEIRVRQLNPFRGLVDVVTCSTNDFHSLVSLGDGTSGWVAETATRSATATPNLRDVQPSFGELYSYPAASNWSLQDMAFDVQSWLVDDIAADFSANEATAIISGNGSARPTGILNTTPVTTSDTASPMRNQNAIQYIPLTTPSSPIRLNIDTLIDLVGSIRERYLMESNRVAWCMHRLTVAALRKQKASTAGMYLWEPSPQAGAPLTLLGFPVVTCDAMALPSTSGGYPVIFGNWRRGYLLADRVGLQITVDEITTPGYTKFYVRKRIGGRPKNNDALKCVKMAES